MGRVLSELAGLPAQTILDEHALAARLQVTKRTIRRMVRRHELPPPVPFAGKSAWMVGKVLAHFSARADHAARAAEREEQRIAQVGAGARRAVPPEGTTVAGKEQSGG